jgi:hypothetical protein
MMPRARLATAFCDGPRLDRAEQRQVRPRRQQFVERGERDILVFRVVRDFDQLVAIVQSRDGGGRCGFVFRMTRDAAQGPRVGRALQRFGAHRFGCGAAGDGRQAA